MTEGNVSSEGSPVELENELRARLHGARLVYADTGLDEDTVERATRAVAAIAVRSGDAVSLLERHYPATLLTYLVGEGVYRYHHGGYWPYLSVAGLDGGSMGRAFERCLMKFDLEPFDKLSDEATLRFVTPILAHGGIPRFSARDLFALLTSALRHYATADAAELVGMWKTRATAFQGIDMPVRRFLLYGGATALDFLGRCVDLIRESDELGSDVGLPSYITDAYRQYLEEVPSARLHKGRSLAPPRILLDPWDQTGPVVELPALPADLGPASWRINDGRIRDYRSSAVEGRTVAVGPARTWDIELSFPAGQRRSTFEALASGVLCFDPRNGVYLPTSRPVALDDVWLVAPKDALVGGVDSEGRPCPLRLRERLLLSAEWTGFAAAHYELSGVRAIEIVYQPVGGDATEATIRVVAPSERPNIVGTPVANAIAENGVDLFDSVPALQVPRLPGYADRRWSIQVKTARGMRHCTLADIGVAGVPIPLIELIPDGFLGLVDLRVRGPLGLDLRRTFGLVPGLRVAVPDALILPGVQRDVSVQVSCAPAVAIGTAAPGLEVTLAVPRDANQISAVASYGELSLGLVVRVAKLVWAIQRLGASTVLAADPVTVDLEVLRSTDTAGLLISTWQPDTTVRLVLAGGDGELMTSEAALTSKREGRWRFPLAPFADTAAVQDEATLHLVLQIEGHTVIVGKVISRVTASAFRIARHDGSSVRVSFSEPRPYRDRVALLWSLDRPWEPPITTAIADGVSGLATFSDREILDGPYRAQVAIADRWTAPRRPHSGQTSTGDVCLGARLRVDLSNADDAPALVLLEWMLATGSRPTSLSGAATEPLLPQILTAAYALLADAAPGPLPLPLQLALTLLFENGQRTADLITQSIVNATVEPVTVLALVVAALPHVPPDPMREATLRALWSMCTPLAAHVDVPLARDGDPDAGMRCAEFLAWSPSSELPVVGTGLMRTWSEMSRGQITEIRDSIALIPKQQLSIDAYVLSTFEWLLAAKEGAEVGAWWNQYKWLAEEAGRMAPTAETYLRARRPGPGSPPWAALPVATLVAALLAATNDEQSDEARAALRAAIPFGHRVVTYDLCLASVLRGAGQDETPLLAAVSSTSSKSSLPSAGPIGEATRPLPLRVARARSVTPSAELLSRLRDWYRRVQKRRAFAVFRDSELVALAQQRPTSRDDLMAILAPDKVDRHGDELLAILSE